MKDIQIVNNLNIKFKLSSMILIIPKCVWSHIKTDFGISSNNEHRKRRIFKSSCFSHITKGYISHKVFYGDKFRFFLK